MKLKNKIVISALLGISALSLLACSEGQLWDPNTPENIKKVDDELKISATSTPSSTAGVSQIANTSSEGTSSGISLSSITATSSVANTSSTVVGSSKAVSSQTQASSIVAGSSVAKSSTALSSVAGSSTALSSVAKSSTALSSVATPSSVVAGSSASSGNAYDSNKKDYIAGSIVTYAGNTWECATGQEHWCNNSTPGQYPGVWVQK